MSDPKTLAVYAAKSNEYAKLTSGASTRDPNLVAFIAALPEGGSALDLGCGPGDSAFVMAQAGIDVHAVDAVPEMVALATQKEGVRAEQRTFDEINEEAVYDGIWANFSLLHAERSSLPRILKSLHTAMRPMGRFHIGMKVGSETTRDKIGRQYTYVTQDELHGLLVAAGFTVTKTVTGRDKGLDGTYADWIAVAADA